MQIRQSWKGKKNYKKKYSSKKIDKTRKTNWIDWIDKIERIDWIDITETKISFCKTQSSQEPNPQQMVINNSCQIVFVQAQNRLYLENQAIYLSFIYLYTKGTDCFIRGIENGPEGRHWAVA